MLPWYCWSARLGELGTLQCWHLDPWLTVLSSSHPEAFPDFCLRPPFFPGSSSLSQTALRCMGLALPQVPLNIWSDFSIVLELAWEKKIASWQSTISPSHLNLPKSQLWHWSCFRLLDTHLIQVPYDLSFNETFATWDSGANCAVVKVCAFSLLGKWLQCTLSYTNSLPSPTPSVKRVIVYLMVLSKVALLDSPQKNGIVSALQQYMQKNWNDRIFAPKIKV